MKMFYFNPSFKKKTGNSINLYQHNVSNVNVNVKKTFKKIEHVNKLKK